MRISFYQLSKNVFTNEHLAKLRSIGGNKKEDSSFVLNSIRFLYKNEIEKISSLSLTGRSRGSKPKHKMSPEKQKIINDMFLERLASLKLHSTEFTDRSKQINTLMKNAFINTKRHGKSTEDELNNKLN